jgi:hypothetical protein
MGNADPFVFPFLPLCLPDKPTLADVDDFNILSREIDLTLLWGCTGRKQGQAQTKRGDP